MSNRHLICTTAPHCPTPLCCFDLVVLQAGWLTVCMQTHTHTLTESWFCVVAGFQMAESHVRVDEWLFVCCFVCCSHRIHISPQKSAPPTMFVCARACVCLGQHYGLLVLQFITTSTTYKSQLWPPHPPLLCWVSFPFLNKAQKYTAMFTVSAQDTFESRP